MKRNLRFLLLFFLFAFSAQAALPPVTIRYVKEGGTGNGSSWTNASGDLQAMINQSGVGDQVWVAAGNYKPNRQAGNSNITANNRYNTFYLKPGVHLYGSFAGNESTITGRQFVTNATILSGDFNDNDVAIEARNLNNATLSKNGENAFHVVVSVKALETDVFDGFTITGGNSNDAAISPQVQLMAMFTTVMVEDCTRESRAVYFVILPLKLVQAIMVGRFMHINQPQKSKIYLYRRAGQPMVAA